MNSKAPLIGMNRLSLNVSKFGNFKGFLEVLIFVMFLVITGNGTYIPGL